jgi:hypothetical protein
MSKSRSDVEQIQHTVHVYFINGLEIVIKMSLRDWNGGDLALFRIGGEIRALLQIPELALRDTQQIRTVVKEEDSSESIPSSSDAPTFAMASRSSCTIPTPAS